MTTHDMQSGPLGTPQDEAGRHSHLTEAPMDAEPVRDVPTGAPMDAEPVRDVPTEAPLASAAAEPVAHRAGSVDEMLFANGELSDLKSRWTEVQGAFVDDPRDCVHKADGLVADVVDKLTAGFTSARSQLEEQWSRGEEVSTEDLRLALQRYRDFFDRLLAV